MNTHVRRVAGLLAAPALAATAVVAVSAPAAQAAPIAAPAGVDRAPAASAAAYLAAQPEASNIIRVFYSYLDESTTPPTPVEGDYLDYGLTIDAGYALDAVGGQTAKLTQITDALQAGIGDYAFGGSSRAKLASFLLAQGRTGADIDALVDALEGNISDDAGTLGRLVETTGDDWNSTLTQSYAVAALDLAASDEADEALAYLLGQQCAAGFFQEYLPAKDAADQTCDAESAVPSVDTTALAVLMLQGQKAGVAEELADATGWLASQQAADGSWGGNANRTGLAGWALGVSGNAAAAGKAAGWLRAHQLANAGTCATYAAKDAGAVTLDDLGFANAASGPLDQIDNSVATRATAQALPALLWAPGGAAAGATTVSATTKLVRAGSTQAVSLRGAPGDTLCVTAAGARTRVVLPASGSASASVKLPGGTRKTAVSVVDAGGETKTVAITGLGARKLPVSVATKIRKGKRLAVRVGGLVRGESVVVSYRGKKVARGKANAKGKATLRFKATKVGRGKLVVRGQFANRKNTKVVTVKR
ncbi:MAG TPA: hypothetical protein VMF51_05460 [Nocardioides sp.]|uniref:hypothetical protein n=1 Tax=Nocardioides sp. TaxID=35761 RepID=UPI002CCD44FD|nr:hypothetical protein [Nocardioides sp.]HTW14557.1 hypothetical protein [Nocardioides sp.]